MDWYVKEGLMKIIYQGETENETRYDFTHFAQWLKESGLEVPFFMGKDSDRDDIKKRYRQELAKMYK